MPADPPPDERPPVDWRSRTIWTRLGYIASAAWMLFVVVYTGNDVAHPLFDYIFTVPLVGWGLGLAAAWLLRRLAPRRE